MRNRSVEAVVVRGCGRGEQLDLRPIQSAGSNRTVRRVVREEGTEEIPKRLWNRGQRPRDVEHEPGSAFDLVVHQLDEALRLIRVDHRHPTAFEGRPGDGLAMGRTGFRARQVAKRSAQGARDRVRDRDDGDDTGQFHQFLGVQPACSRLGIPLFTETSGIRRDAMDGFEHWAGERASSAMVCVPSIE